jgi:hypothetical protein
MINILTFKKTKQNTRGGDQEDYSLRPTLAKTSQDLISTNKKLDAVILYHKK